MSTVLRLAAQGWTDKVFVPPCASPDYRSWLDSRRGAEVLEESVFIVDHCGIHGDLPRPRVRMYLDDVLLDSRCMLCSDVYTACPGCEWGWTWFYEKHSEDGNLLDRALARGVRAERRSFLCSSPLCRKKLRSKIESALGRWYQDDVPFTGFSRGPVE